MRITTILAAATLATGLAASTLAAQAPQAGWRAEFLNSLGGGEKKYVALAEAMPWEKYSWRPGEGVRSVCEVFMHIAGANYLFATPLGAQTPANVDPRSMQTCPANRDQVVSTLKASFAHLRNAVNATPDAQADENVEIFGMKMTKRGLLLFSAEHMGEHLGQSIAYARVNNVVPPWSARGGN
ncbi:MAG TPA: DinB family protein [Gemmatimonadaceae bacterium]|jgi:uncharacterized damage-inducible protein DinB|nr:DinB family protein [Gemmatimonadaceae bacterium]